MRRLGVVCLPRFRVAVFAVGVYTGVGAAVLCRGMAGTAEKFTAAQRRTVARVKRCCMCNKPLPKGRSKFCCDACAREARNLNIPREGTAPAPRVSIEDILHFANEYKKQTGVYLDYAKARAEMKRRGYPV